LGSGTALASLPDNRVYEPVSPVATEGSSSVYIPEVGGTYLTGNGEHGIPTRRPFEVAPDGEAVVYSGDPPEVGPGARTGLDNGATYLATRSAGGGWSASDLQPPETIDPSYVTFSGDLSVGILDALGGRIAGAGGPAGYEDLYAHPTAGGDYAPLFTRTPPNRTPEEFNRGIVYAGANAGAFGVTAASHELFEASDALLEGSGALESELTQAVKGTVEEQESLSSEAKKLNEEHRESDAREKEALETGKEEARVLYDTVDGRPVLVSVLPNGKPDVDASFGSLPSEYMFQQGSKAPGFSPQLISTDGSRIFWTAGEVAVTKGITAFQRPLAIYVRENDAQPQSPVEGGKCSVPADACTLLVAEGDEPTFLTASSDGSVVFYTNNQGNLYSFDVETGQTSDLSVAVDPSEPARVRGVLGASENGEYVYFAAGGVLASNKNSQGETATRGSCEPAEEREEKEEEGRGQIVAGRACNVYVYHAGEPLRFIASLPAGDGGDSEAVVPLDGGGAGLESGDWQAAANYRTAQVTPDGRDLVFMANRDLTGYDSELTAFNPIEGYEDEESWGLQEVYLYEAQTATLRCVSCNPSGEAPVTTEFNRYEHSGGTPVGAFIPTADTSSARVQPRVISAKGSRIFFDSGEPLSPAVTNGWLNVYEWEAPGEGSCMAASSSYSDQTGGCTFVLSGGVYPESSYLIGADETGDNVFFITRAQLSGTDRNESMDVYDARVGGVEPASPSACQGTGCQGVPPAPPIFSTPASSTFTGSGNYPPATSTQGIVKTPTRAQKLAKALRTCRRDRSKKKRTACEKQARARYGAKSKKPAHKASDDRRPSR
jgi:hypothetical protein